MANFFRRRRKRIVLPDDPEKEYKEAVEAVFNTKKPTKEKKLNTYANRVQKILTATPTNDELQKMLDAARQAGVMSKADKQVFLTAKKKLTTQKYFNLRKLEARQKILFPKSQVESEEASKKFKNYITQRENLIEEARYVITLTPQKVQSYVSGEGYKPLEPLDMEHTLRLQNIEFWNVARQAGKDLLEAVLATKAQPGTDHIKDRKRRAKYVQFLQAGVMLVISIFAGYCGIFVNEKRLADESKNVFKQIFSAKQQPLILESDEQYFVLPTVENWKDYALKYYRRLDLWYLCMPVKRHASKKRQQRLTDKLDALAKKKHEGSYDQCNAGKIVGIAAWVWLDVRSFRSFNNVVYRMWRNGKNWLGNKAVKQSLKAIKLAAKGGTLVGSHGIILLIHGFLVTILHALEEYLIKAANKKAVKAIISRVNRCLKMVNNEYVLTGNIFESYSQSFIVEWRLKLLILQKEQEKEKTSMFEAVRHQRSVGHSLNVSKAFKDHAVKTAKKLTRRVAAGLQFRSGTSDEELKSQAYNILRIFSKEIEREEKKRKSLSTLKKAKNFFKHRDGDAGEEIAELDSSHPVTIALSQIKQAVQKLKENDHLQAIVTALFGDLKKKNKRIDSGLQAFEERHPGNMENIHEVLESGGRAIFETSQGAFELYDHEAEQLELPKLSEIRQQAHLLYKNLQDLEGLDGNKNKSELKEFENFSAAPNTTIIKTR